MHAQLLENVPQRLAQRFVHQALALGLGVDAVAQRAGHEGAAHELGEVGQAHDRPRRLAAVQPPQPHAEDLERQVPGPVPVGLGDHDGGVGLILHVHGPYSTAASYMALMFSTGEPGAMLLPSWMISPP